jgi:hypothetical protein
MGTQGITGAQGASGFNGAQGSQGTQGIQGVQGTQGIQGEQGIQGIQGIQGTQGTQGIQGIQGTQGTQGIQGEQGIQGIQGIQGTQGTQGIQGTQGTQGIQGTQGEQGIQGTQGTQGVQGIAGYQGINGAQGTQGVQGIQGVQGTQGAQGLTGSQGTAGTFGGAAFDYTFDTSTTNADPGTGKLRLSNADLSLASALYINENDDLSVSIYNFLQTIDDSTSTIKGHFTITQKNDTNNFALFSITGAHSHGTNYFNVPVAYLSGATSFTNALDIIITFARTGDVGATGAQGTQGIQGIQGVQGTQGIQGEQGIQGIQGIQGVQGTQGIQGIQGAQGTQGIQGVQGAQGTQGIQGIQGTQGIQGVQGLQGIQGVQGTAGYIGADGAQGTIGTQGAQGLQGIQGIQGVQGIQGTQGTQGVQGITGVNANVLTSDTAPVSPNAGDLWWDSSVGMMRIYYNDGTSSQWVDVDPGSVQGIQGVQGTQGIQGVQGIQGIQGVQGIQGTQGTQGIQGIQGISGASILGTANTWTNTNAFTSVSASSKVISTATTASPATSGTTQGGPLRLAASNGTALDFGAYAASPYGQWIQTADTTNLATTYPLILNPNGGNVGIGTTSPIAPLTVASSTTLAAGEPSLVLQGVSNTERLHIRSALGAAAGQPVMFLAAARGTIASPTAVQDGDDLGFYQLGGYNGTVYRRGAWINGKAEGAHSATSSGAAILFQTTENGSLVMTERMRITGSGNVGIGTTSPAYKLHLSGGSDTRIQIDATSTQGFYFTKAGTNNGTFRVDTDGNFEFYTKTVSQAMVLTAAGNVGIGTTSPAQLLHVNSASASDRVARFSSGSIYGTKLEIYSSGTGGRNYEISSTANSATEGGGRFSIYDSTASSTRLAIDSSGNVGIGTTSPGVKLDVNGAIYAGGKLRINREDTGSEGGQLELCNASGNTVAWYFDAYGSSSTPDLRIFDASAVGVKLVSGSTSWSTMSDINLKTDLQPIVNAVDALKDIRCVTYHLKDKDEPTSRKRIGIIAQDIMGKIDEALDSSHNEADGKDYLSVRYTELVPHLIKAVQELSEKNKALEVRLAALESK